MNRLTYPQIVQALKWVWISIFLGLVGLTFAKWAIIALLLQVQLPTQVKRRMFLWSLAVILGVVCVVQFVLSFTQCIPAQRLWNPRMAGSCPGATRALYFGFLSVSTTKLRVSLANMLVVKARRASRLISFWPCILSQLSGICKPA